MTVYIKPRQSGKSTTIAEQVAWCALFDELPVVVLFPHTRALQDWVYKILPLQKITQQELALVYLKVAPTTRSGSAANSINIVHEITRMHPRRIYLDDIGYMDATFINDLRELHDDIMYAYGTPGAGGSNSFKFIQNNT